LSTLR